MTLNQRVILLLLGLAVTSGAATAVCVLSQDMTRCLCNIADTSGVPQIELCAPAVELELTGGKLDIFEMALFGQASALQLLQKNKIIFNNVTISLNTGLNRFSFVLPEFGISLSQIKALRLEETTVDASVLQPSFQVLHNQLLDSLESLGLVRAGLVEIECYWAQRLKSLSHLDLSDNPISYAGLQNISHCPSLSFSSLTSVHLRNSGLTSLQSLCTPLTLAPALAELDVSGSNFSVFHYPRCLQAKRLRMLNLSCSRITDVSSLLSASLEELDLSYNSLEVFSNPLRALKKLYLSNNRLISLPSLGSLSHLQELKLDGNQLVYLVNESSVSLSTLKQLDVLRAGRNPYQCDCGLRETITFLDNDVGVSVEDFPEEFLCTTPAAQHGKQIMNSSLETCVNSTSWTQHHSPPLCLILFTCLLSHLIHLS